MAQTSANAEAAAIHLDEALHPKPRAKESDVERHLMATFEALGGGPSAQHTAPSGGIADIYVTDYQLVAKIKRLGQLHPTRRGYRRKVHEPNTITTRCRLLSRAELLCTVLPHRCTLVQRLSNCDRE